MKARNILRISGVFFINRWVSITCSWIYCIVPWDPDVCHSNFFAIVGDTNSRQWLNNHINHVNSVRSYPACYTILIMISYLNSNEIYSHMGWLDIDTYHPIRNSIRWHVAHPIIDSCFVIIRIGIIVRLLDKEEIEWDVRTLTLTITIILHYDINGWVGFG